MPSGSSSSSSAKRQASSSSYGGNKSPSTPQKQARLSSFFTSPRQQTTAQFHNAEGESGAEAALTQEQKDEELARKLQAEWDLIDGQQERRVDNDDKEPKESVTTKEDESNARLHLTNGRGEGGSNGSSAAQKHTNTSFDWLTFDAAIEAIDLQEDIFIFDPAKVDVSAWPTRQRSKASSTSSLTIKSTTQPSAPYALLSHACVLLSTTRSRLAIVTILTNLLRTLMYHDQQSLLPCIYLVSNHIAPPYDGVEMGLGGQIVNKAIQSVTGKSSSHLRKLWNKTGDPGDVAFEAKKDVKTLIGTSKPIEISKLFSTLHSIASISGQGSSAAKMSHVTRLLAASRGEETRFLVRTFQSHLRINAVRTTITSAIARTFALDGIVCAPEMTKSECEKAKSDFCISKEERQGIRANPTTTKQRNDPRRLQVMEKILRSERLLREIRARHPNFSNIVPALLQSGLSQLARRVPLCVGTPLSPMLGSITRSLTAMFDKLGDRPFVAEFKYDGQRVQIHAQYVGQRSDGVDDESERLLRTQLNRIGGKGKWVGRRKNVFVRLFSRHLEDMTDKYPDITALVPIMMGVDEEEEVLLLSNTGEFRHSVEGTLHVSDKNEEDSRSAHTPASVKNGRVGVTSFILDAEVVAMSLDGTLLPFQTLTNRSRKDVELQNVKVAVGVFAFDLMQINGKSLLKSSLRKRRSLMNQHLPPCIPSDSRIARFNYVKSIESHQIDEVSAFFDLARQNKCEG